MKYNIGDKVKFTEEAIDFLEILEYSSNFTEDTEVEILGFEDKDDAELGVYYGYAEKDNPCTKIYFNDSFIKPDESLKMKSEIFLTESYYKIDNETPVRFGDDGYYFSETGKPKDLLKLEKLSFKELLEYNKEHPINGISFRNTLFRKKPYFYIQGYYEDSLRFEEKSFKFISFYIASRKATSNLEWLFKHLKSEEAIKYLRDRGMNTCPLGKGK